jgi:hypothetical protein
MTRETRMTLAQIVGMARSRNRTALVWKGRDEGTFLIYISQRDGLMQAARVIKENSQSYAA